MNKLWGREPALILGALQAVIALAIAFGLDLSTEQTGAILAASAAVLAVVTRSQVAPLGQVAAVEAPAQAPTEYVAGPAAQVPEGEPVHVVRDIDSVKGAVTREVNDALRQPADPLERGNGDEDYR